MTRCHSSCAVCVDTWRRKSNAISGRHTSSAAVCAHRREPACTGLRRQERNRCLPGASRGRNSYRRVAELYSHLCLFREQYPTFAVSTYLNRFVITVLPDRSISCFFGSRSAFWLRLRHSGRSGTLSSAPSRHVGVGCSWARQPFPYHRTETISDLRAAISFSICVNVPSCSLCATFTGDRPFG